MGNYGIADGKWQMGDGERNGWEPGDGSAVYGGSAWYNGMIRLSLLTVLCVELLYCTCSFVA